MCFLTPEDFVTQVLPRLVGTDGKELDVIVSTYRRVEGYRNGPVILPNRPGLNVVVVGAARVDGRMREVDMAIINEVLSPTSAFWTTGGDKVTAKGRAIAAEIQGENEEKILPLVAKRQGRPLLLIAYAGLTDFDGPVGFVRRVCQKHPSAAGVIVTCDCQVESKSSRLRPFIEDGSIAAGVVTPDCGGQIQMRRLIEEIIALWPKETVCSD